MAEWIGDESQRINVDLVLLVVRLADGTFQVTLSGGAVVIVGGELGEKVWQTAGGA